MAMGPILGPGRRGRRAPMSEINVTPMVDVMLVLLIIFMVTAPLLASGVQVDVPESKAAPLEQSGAPIALSMTRPSPTITRARSYAVTGSSATGTEHPTKKPKTITAATEIKFARRMKPPT